MKEEGEGRTTSKLLGTASIDSVSYIIVHSPSPEQRHNCEGIDVRMMSDRNREDEGKEEGENKIT